MPCLSLSLCVCLCMWIVDILFIIWYDFVGLFLFRLFAYYSNDTFRCRVCKHNSMSWNRFTNCKYQSKSLTHSVRWTKIKCVSTKICLFLWFKATLIQIRSEWDWMFIWTSNLSTSFWLNFKSSPWISLSVINYYLYEQMTVAAQNEKCISPVVNLSFFCL